jgi:hypothetical protein
LILKLFNCDQPRDSFSAFAIASSADPNSVHLDLNKSDSFSALALLSSSLNKFFSASVHSQPDFSSALVLLSFSGNCSGRPSNNLLSLVLSSSESSCARSSAVHFDLIACPLDHFLVSSTFASAIAHSSEIELSILNSQI